LKLTTNLVVYILVARWICAHFLNDCAIEACILNSYHVSKF